MPVTKITSGEMEVFDSGTVTAFRDEPIEFTLEHPDDEDVLKLIGHRDRASSTIAMSCSSMRSKGPVSICRVF